MCDYTGKSRKVLDRHLLKVHGKIMDRRGRTVMDAHYHPTQNQPNSYNGRPMQGGAPSLGRKK